MVDLREATRKNQVELDAVVDMVLIENHELRELLVRIAMALPEKMILDGRTAFYVDHDTAVMIARLARGLIVARGEEQLAGVDYSMFKEYSSEYSGIVTTGLVGGARHLDEGTPPR